MRTIRFSVLGKAQPAGSKKGFVHPHTKRVVIVDDAKKSRPWKQQVAGAAAEQMDGDLLAGPLELDITFVLGRPRSHYGTGANSGRVRPSSPAFPITRPDATKLLRAAEDAMQGVIYRDDAQIVDQNVRKRYGSPERCEVVVRELVNELEAAA
jgi:Holliday junction resolvase RusA-like endonuclease